MHFMIEEILVVGMGMGLMVNKTMKPLFRTVAGPNL
jgi:hypothetical protein